MPLTSGLDEQYLPGYEYPLVGELPDDDDSLWPRGRVPSAIVPLELVCKTTGRRHQLRVVTFVGRSRAILRKCDLVIDKPDISRVHCRIEVRPIEGAGGLAAFAVDYDDAQSDEYGEEFSMSKYGTMVDGQDVEPNNVGMEMYIGSVIRFGEEELWELVKAPLVFEKPAPIPDVKMGDRRKWIKLPAQIYMAITRLSTWGELALVLLEAFREIEVLSTDTNKGIEYLATTGIEMIEVFDDTLDNLEDARLNKQHHVITLEFKTRDDELSVQKIKKDLRPGYIVRCRFAVGDPTSVSTKPAALHDDRPLMATMVDGAH
jgi:pSer/pThr/pTyr-binding forkhead associated (FHA) protein